MIASTQNLPCNLILDLGNDSGKRMSCSRYWNRPARREGELSFHDENNSSTIHSADCESISPAVGLGEIPSTIFRRF